ncbi:MAG: hypothetical protein HY585_04090 [Candidatus Omnitrophica bacterium]|nr:hypothetical protein [Candidatus Omnitrophota bacterium]
MQPLLDNFQIVLVRAGNPANIGQAARAMKNFGFHRLTLVDSAPHRVQEAYTLGWNAKEILDGAHVINRDSGHLNLNGRCPYLKEALSHSILSVGFTRRSGHSRGEPGNFLEVLPQVLEAAKDGEVSLVFGNEKNGLSNDELRQCHLAVALPTSREYGSLNLSHAVAIACFLVFSAASGSELEFRKPERCYATQGELDGLMEDFRGVLECLDYRDSPLNDLLSRNLRNLERLFKKAGIERREFHMFKAFLSRVEQRLNAGAGKPRPLSDSGPSGRGTSPLHFE